MKKKTILFFSKNGSAHVCQLLRQYFNCYIAQGSILTFNSSGCAGGLLRVQPVMEVGFDQCSFCRAAGATGHTQAISIETVLFC